MHLSRYLKTTALILSFAFLPLCSSENQELAQFKSGSILRKELRIILEATGMSAEEATIEAQDRTLQNIAFIRLAALESPDSAGNAALNEAEALLATTSVLLRRKAKDTRFRMADYQFLFLAKSGADRLAEAQALEAQLNDPSQSDQAIEDLIYEKNEKQRYRFLGGYLDPHCISCQPNPLDFLSLPLEETELRKFKTIDSADGYWIARKIEIREIRSDKLQDAFEDYHRKVTRIALRQTAKLPEEQQKQMREGLMNQEQIEKLSARQAEAQVQRGTASGLQQRLQELRQKNAFTMQEHDAVNLKPDTVLFSVGEKTFRYSDLQAMLPPEKLARAEEMQILHSIVIPFTLIQLDPEFKDVKQSPEYTFLLELKSKESQARQYFGKRMTEFQATAEDIEDYYSLKKNSDYAGKSLGQVRAEIERTLNESRSQESMKKIRDELAAKYELKILRDRLKAGKV